MSDQDKQRTESVNMYKVTVIVPIYGVEKYIVRCAQSLFSQTLDSIEFVFVNDCTLDNSITLLESEISKYQAVINEKNWSVSIRKMPKNGGLAAVRKYGMQFATGEYIIHCDSDDWIDKNMLKTLYDTAIAHTADVVICDYYVSDGNTNRHMPGVEVNDKKHLLRSLIKTGDWTTWDKLVKRELYLNNPIAYATGDMGEDVVLTTQLLYHSRKTVTVHQPLYYYCYNPTSITKQKTAEVTLKKFRHCCGNMQVLSDALQKHEIGQDNKKGLDYLKFSRRNLLLPLISDDNYYKEWSNTFSEINSRIMFNPFISFKEKLRFYKKYLRL